MVLGGLQVGDSFRRARLERQWTDSYLYQHKATLMLLERPVAAVVNTWDRILYPGDWFKLRT